MLDFIALFTKIITFAFKHTIKLNVSGDLTEILIVLT
jgi:hypothetical protein